MRWCRADGGRREPHRKWPSTVGPHTGGWSESGSSFRPHRPGQRRLSGVNPQRPRAVARDVPAPTPGHARHGARSACVTWSAKHYECGRRASGDIGKCATRTRPVREVRRGRVSMVKHRCVIAASGGARASCSRRGTGYAPFSGSRRCTVVRRNRSSALPGRRRARRSVAPWCRTVCAAEIETAIRSRLRD